MVGEDLMHCVKYLLGIEKPNTQTTASERALITKYANGKELAVEIGVYEAVNTVVIAEAVNNSGKVYGIDPFFKGKLGICYSKLVARTNLSRSKTSKKVTLIEKLSFDAVDDIKDNIDFIFIDGDHTYEGLKKDWHSYSPKVKIGGFALLHDTTVPSFHPERAYLGSVQYFADEIIKDPRFQLIETADSLNVLKRIH